MEATKFKEPIEVKGFVYETKDGKTNQIPKSYVYFFPELTIYQTEICKELGLYRYNQTSVDPKSFDELVNSKSCDWLFYLCRYLFVEQVNGAAADFDPAKVLSTEEFLKNLKVSEREKLYGVVEDFFTGIGMGKIGSMLLQGKNNLKTLISVLETSIGGSKKNKQEN